MTPQKGGNTMTTLLDDLITVAEEKMKNNPTVIEQRNQTMRTYVPLILVAIQLIVELKKLVDE